MFFLCVLRAGECFLCVLRAGECFLVCIEGGCMFGGCGCVYCTCLVDCRRVQANGGMGWCVGV